ncbi:hypothetical protein ACIGNX_22370 [Actinosynnema sp. NPDC053489]|uniref:hypothetical protein n=1 Tax=Actinosynnema sp. NPDC053489 TaxID=3363916 RepID=UPI0037CBF5AE
MAVKTNPGNGEDPGADLPQSGGSTTSVPTTGSWELKADTDELRKRAYNSEVFGERIKKFADSWYPVLSQKPLKSGDQGSLQDESWQQAAPVVAGLLTGFFTGVLAAGAAVTGVAKGLTTLAKAHEQAEDNNVAVGRTALYQLPPPERRGQQELRTTDPASGDERLLVASERTGATVEPEWVAEPLRPADGDELQPRLGFRDSPGGRSGETSVLTREPGSGERLLVASERTDATAEPEWIAEPLRPADGVDGDELRPRLGLREPVDGGPGWVPVVDGDVVPRESVAPGDPDEPVTFTREPGSGERLLVASERTDTTVEPEWIAQGLTPRTVE